MEHTETRELDLPEPIMPGEGTMSTRKVDRSVGPTRPEPVVARSPGTAGSWGPAIHERTKSIFVVCLRSLGCRFRV